MNLPQFTKLWTEYNTYFDVTCFFSIKKILKNRMGRIIQKYFNMSTRKYTKVRISFTFHVDTLRNSNIIDITFLIRQFPHHLNDKKKQKANVLQKNYIRMLTFKTLIIVHFSSMNTIHHAHCRMANGGRTI